MREFSVTIAGRTRHVRIVPPGPGGGEGTYVVHVDGRRLSVEAHDLGPGIRTLSIDGRTHRVHLARQAGGAEEIMVGGELWVTRVESPLEARARECARRGQVASLDCRVMAPMPGKVVLVGVAVGDRVLEGTKLLVLEAMKMENEIRARAPGRVKAVHVARGQAVEGGALVMEIEAVSTDAPPGAQGRGA